MEGSRYPRINRFYTSFVVVLGFAASSLFLWVAINNSSDIYASSFLAAFGFAVAVAPVLIAYRASKLQVTKSGISSRKMDLSWDEITDVVWVHYGLHLKAGNRKIVLAPYIYKNPKALIRFVEKAIASAT